MRCGLGLSALRRETRAACARAGGPSAVDTPAKRRSVAELEGKSKATSVEAIRKYREAKEAAAAKESSAARGADDVGEKPTPPPKVDLFK